MKIVDRIKQKIKGKHTYTYIERDPSGKIIEVIEDF